MEPIRAGDWREALADIEQCDSLITDPPYSERTAGGYRSHGMIANGRTAGVPYGSITEKDAFDLAEIWAARTARWAVIFGDHISWGWHERAWTSRGWHTFAPVIWCRKAAPPRFRGDGPSSQVDHVMVARPRGLAPDGSRPGWYLADTVRANHGHLGITGQKDLNVMRALVRDYTHKGDVVVDPYCGSGTTALACAIEGRVCHTSEIDPENLAIAQKRLDAGYTMEMF
jgi:site-specific DNA-methyltransferase (adenine-specific)